MLNHQRKSYMTVCVLSLVTNSCIARDAKVANLSLTVEPGKPTYTVGEPLVVRVAIENTGKQPVELIFDLSSWTTSGIYEISRDGQSFDRIVRSGVDDPVDIRAVVIPGEAVRHWEIFAYDTQTKRPLLMNPGRYWLRMRAEWIRTADSWPELIPSVLSDTVSFVVVEPSPSDAQAFKQLDNAKVLRALEGSWMVEDALDALEAIAGGDSTYATYTSYRLAGHELSKLRAPGNHDDELRGLEFIDRVRVQREWAERALARLEKADVEGFPLRAEAVRAKLEAHRFKSSLTKSGFLKHGRLRAETLALMQERYPDLWTSEVEAERLEKRLLTEFPDSAAAWRLRKELEAVAARGKP